MKSYKYLLLSLAFLFSVTACQKEEAVSPATKISPISAAQYLAQHFTCPILFHFAELNEETQEHQGWFIDRWGAVKSYTTSLQDPKAIPEEQQCGVHLLDNLYALADQSHGQVDLATLVEKFKLIRKIQLSLLSSIQLENKTTQSTFYAFNPEKNYNGDTHCYDQNGDLVDVFNRILLQANGKENQTNHSAAAQEILSWLQSIQEDNQL
ncbi:MAG: hypothetical protein AB8G15_01010 [Saprospiraceae bacterium]